MIAIIAAMDEELNEIKDLMSSFRIETIRGIDFLIGVLNSKEVLIFKSGVGLTNAAMRASIACDHFDLSEILNIGTAGGIAENVKVLDVIISTRITYHELDLSVFANPRNFSDANQFVYKADERLIAIASALSDNALVGPMVSGNQFISKVDQITDIEKYYPEALCADMEAAAIAQVADYFKIPFIILRSISDHVKHLDNHLSFEAYLKKASKRSADFAYKFVGEL